MGYRDTADRWVGLRGAGLAPHCAPCPVPPAGHPHPWGTQQGATLGARPHTRVFATRGWAHARTRVFCRAAGGSRAARASPRGYFYPAPLAPVAPILPQQPLRGRWGTQRGGQRPRCQLHGTARPFLPHNMVIPAPQRGHPSPTMRSSQPHGTVIPALQHSNSVPRKSSSPRAVPCRTVPAALAVPTLSPPRSRCLQLSRLPPATPPPRPRPHRWAQRCPLCAGWVLWAWGDRGRLVVHRRGPPGPAASMRPLFCAGPWWPQEHCCGGGLSPAGGRGQCQPGVCPPPLSPCTMHPPYPVPTVPTHPCPHALGHPPHP